MSAADRARRRVVALLVPALVVPALVVALSGCTAAESQPTASPSSTPSPTRTPYFTSEKAALDAATKTYQRFIELSDQVLQAGGKGDEVYKEVLTGKALSEDLKDAKGFRRVGHRTLGRQSLISLKNQRTQFDVHPGISMISAYVCVDVSKVDVVNQEGISVVNPKKKPIFDRVVTFNSSMSAKYGLLISEDKFWSGRDFCA